MSVARSLGLAAPSSPSSTFYVSPLLAEAQDTFFEDMTSLYRRQAVLFQRSCTQVGRGGARGEWGSLCRRAIRVK